MGRERGPGRGAKELHGAGGDMASNERVGWQRGEWGGDEKRVAVCTVATWRWITITWYHT